MKSVTNLSLENNLLIFRLNAPVVITFTLMVTGAFSRNLSKLYSKLKLVTDINLFIYTACSQLRSH